MVCANVKQKIPDKCKMAMKNLQLVSTLNTRLFRLQNVWTTFEHVSFISKISRSVMCQTCLSIYILTEISGIILGKW